ncbi:MAG TPA: TonB-dependent receptor [Candidatus Acidoferrales bacterium]|nr:TonB-dependent receptor [Candidatus Acidoferrales bacterium]
MELVRRIVLASVLFCLTGAICAAEEARIEGVVRDAQGAVVPSAEVSLRTAQQAVVATTQTDAQGRFKFEDLARGSYLLVVTAPGLAERRLAVKTGAGAVEVMLTIGEMHAEVTVTATPGRIESTQDAAQSVVVIGADELERRAKSVVAQVAEGSPGVHLQRTSPTISGIFVRGLTGNKVNVFVDGVRYSTSAMRGGINTFMNLIDPTNLEAVEILRGPSSAQYGSDALGGSVQFLTRTPALSAGTPAFHGRTSSFFNSVDAGFGSNASLSYAGKKLGVVANLAGRRANGLLVGQGLDSHAAVTRFFGLPSTVLVGGRLPGTSFTQYGGMFRANWTPVTGTSITANYIRGQQDGGRRYDQLLGGDGNLIADLRNLMNDLFYLRFDRARAGWLDDVVFTYSFNAQREERVNQVGNGNPNGNITHERERTTAHGVQGMGMKQWTARLSSMLGAEFYHERIAAPAFAFNPVTSTITLTRPRVPHNAHYKSGGIYLQNILELVPRKLRLVGNVRYSAASYRARAADSPLVGGLPLWPDDSLRASDWTGRVGVSFTPVEPLTLAANISRGFRAPHMTDLGTLGITGNGFEVAARDIAGLGGTVGSTADSTAASTGRAVTQVQPETNWSYEFSARVRHSRFESDLAFFVNDIHDNITKQSLILPPGAVGTSLGGQIITAQNANGVVFVAASSSQVLVRTNFDNARIWGVEHDMEVKLASAWSLRSVFSYAHARDTRTGLPPNIEGGTPAPDGWLKLRYMPAASRFWVEPYVHAAGRQSRLSSLDLSDRRVGAERSRGNIANFFARGARVRGMIGPGPDTLFGTADDVLLATGETLLQVQDRVLGVGVNSAPMLRALPGYVTFNIRGGFRLGERHDFTVDFENIGDRNYRGISWGVDAPGRGVTLRYSARF